MRMSAQFSIFNVSAEFLMDVAKVLASSPHPLANKDLFRSFKKSSKYVSDALSQCVQLGLAEIQESGFYISCEKHRDLIKRSNRSQLHLALREALQGYPPFLLYIDFISKGYASEQSADMVRGILRIQSPEKIVEKSLRNWGLGAHLIVADKSGTLAIPEAEQGLPSEYIQSLMRAFKADLQARIFLIETMSPQAFAYLAGRNIGIDDLSDALVNYEKDSKNSAGKACQTFEHFLFKFGEDVGANVGNANGIIQYANTIKGERQSVMTTNQKHICDGIGGLRNMALHSPDKETGQPWTFTPQGAIISTVIVPTMIRSIYLYWKENKQEF